MKRSWLTDIPKKDLDKSFETLDYLFGVEELRCVNGSGVTSMFRVDIDTVLTSGEVVEASVTEVGNGYLILEDGTRCEGVVIVAAGAWSGELLPQYPVIGKKGISWVYEIQEQVANRVHTWAPYKQIVLTSHGPGKIWIGDGTAIKTENWTEEREHAIQKRLFPYLPRTATLQKVQRGIRPYMKM